MKPLADTFTTVYRSGTPDTVFCYSPGLVKSPNGRLIATLDLGGPGAPQLPGTKYLPATGRFETWAWQGKVFASDDGGKRWCWKHDYPFMHARPFYCGNTLYVLGQAGHLMISRSDDDGESWTDPVRLSTEGEWHQAPCNVLEANGYIYLVMEHVPSDQTAGWPVNVLAPVLMKGKLNDDLTRPDAWTYATAPTFRDILPSSALDYMGFPFFPTNNDGGNVFAPGRDAHRIGWLESNVVQIKAPNHCWYDPNHKTFHLLLRTNTHTTGFAALLKVVEHEDGSMTTHLQETPSGLKQLFLPMPGGQMKFHILYDEVSALYWLLSTQATDSMTRVEDLPDERYGLPNNERHRLQLHFSTNCVDWCFAGMVAIGNSPRESRHYASMVIDRDDLLVLSRSGDRDAVCAHNGNLITFHRVRHFRKLVY